jgi:hypothetical protein
MVIVIVIIVIYHKEIVNGNPEGVRGGNGSLHEALSPIELS